MEILHTKPDGSYTRLDVRNTGKGVLLCVRKGEKGKSYSDNCIGLTREEVAYLGVWFGEMAKEFVRGDWNGGEE